MGGPESGNAEFVALFINVQVGVPVSFSRANHLEPLIFHQKERNLILPAKTHVVDIVFYVGAGKKTTAPPAHKNNTCGQVYAL